MNRPCRLQRRSCLAALLGLAACAGAPRAASGSARFVLLGEVHDNAEHHRQRAARLRALLADGRPTVVVFEPLAAGRGAALAAAREAEAVADAGALDRRAWGWPLHKPLVEAALAGGARIAGGGLEPALARAVVREGEAAVPPALRALLAADTAWGTAQQHALEASLDEGHCGALPARLLPGMALAQRTRDAAMAQALLAAPAGARAVLIAGNGHVRRDLGVPRLLRAAGVAASEIEVWGYLEAGEAAAPSAFDRVVTAPPAQREDPCKGLRR